jgi:hypothetical protein
MHDQNVRHFLSSSVCIDIYNLNRSFIYEIAGIHMEEELPLNIIVFASTLLQDYLTSHSDDGKDNEEKFISVPWSLWGERTRLTLWSFPDTVYNIWTNGTRLVRQIPGNAPDHFHIQVCDFNKYLRIEDDAVYSGKETSVQRYVQAGMDNKVTNTLIFKDNLYGNLPYMEITTKKSFHISSVMIDYERLYLVRVSKQLRFRHQC